MYISFLFALLGGFLHFIFFHFLKQPSSNFLIDILLPILLTVAILFIGLKTMRKTNHGWMSFKEGFFTGMNICTGSGILVALLIWIYFSSSSNEAWLIAQSRGMERDIFLAHQDQLILRWAFSGFFFTSVSGIPFALLLAYLLKSGDRQKIAPS